MNSPLALWIWRSTLLCKPRARCYSGQLYWSKAEAEAFLSFPVSPHSYSWALGNCKVLLCFDYTKMVWKSVMCLQQRVAFWLSRKVGSWCLERKRLIHHSNKWWLLSLSPVLSFSCGLIHLTLLVRWASQDCPHLLLREPRRRELKTLPKVTAGGRAGNKPR